MYFLLAWPRSHYVDQAGIGLAEICQPLFTFKWVCTHTQMWGKVLLELEGLDPAVTGITGSCEMPNMGAGIELSSLNDRVIPPSPGVCVCVSVYVKGSLGNIFGICLYLEVASEPLKCLSFVYHHYPSSSLDHFENLCGNYGLSSWKLHICGKFYSFKRFPSSPEVVTVDNHAIYIYIILN